MAQLGVARQSVLRNSYEYHYYVGWVLAAVVITVAGRVTVRPLVTKADWNLAQSPPSIAD